MKTIGGLRKLRHCGGELVDWIVTFTAVAYKLGPAADVAREARVRSSRGAQVLATNTAGCTREQAW